jgi:hypothetical protein
MIENLQDSTRSRLVNRLRFSADSIRSNYPLWTRGGWKRFIDSPPHVRQVIRYIEQNPTEVGLPPQSWTFVKPYDNWPFQLTST